MPPPHARIHPTAITEGAEVGDGTSVWAHVHIMPGARIGKNCNICDNVFIENDVLIGNCVTIKNQAMLWTGVTIADFVFIGPGVSFTNDLYPRSARLPDVQERYSAPANWLVETKVDEGVAIGARATIVCGTTLGSFCSIAAGSVVTRDVEPFQLVAGVPARPIGKVNREGAVLQEVDGLWVEPKSGKRYRFTNNEMEEIDE